MDDIIKNLEKVNPLVATEADLLSIGATIQRTRKSETQAPLTDVPVKFDQKKEIIVPNNEDKTENREQDFEYMRKNLYSIIETSSTALNELGQIAARSQHPRAYEVLAILVKTISDANKDLMKIHSEKTHIEKEEKKTVTPKTITNNNLFVGSTAELDEICREAMLNMKKKDE